MKTIEKFWIVLLFCFLANFTFAQPFGLTQRVANTTLQMPQNPLKFGYDLTNAFPGLSLTNPIAMATPPGETNRLFIVERFARIVVVTNLANPTRTTFLDLTSVTTQGCEEGLLGLAFHPNYASNGFFYVFYSRNANTTGSVNLHQRVARFHVSPINPNQADSASELPLITQFDQACNHNGGDLHFGPDGYLYISVGDEGGGDDNFNNSQRIDQDFFSGILRIDVDKLPGNLPPTPHPSLMNATNYFIPADNPFVSATQFNGTNLNSNAVRKEFFAVGLRNPFRFSIDPVTGVIYCGDVGQGAREEVDVIVKGGNYGWAFREGTIAGPKTAPAGFSSINPITDYGRALGNVITGGLVYRGSRISQLTGRYIFSDFGSGNIWALTPNGTNAVPFDLLTVRANIAAFGVDPSNGDLLLANIVSGVIHRLIYSTNVLSGAALPPTLADTGSFSNLTSLAPNPGIVPYEINVPFWSDNAQKTRWFSVPNTNLTLTFNRTGNWQFPTGTVWIKHFDLELTNGVPASAKRLETRLIVKNSDGVYGVTYRWGNSLTNATLVPEEGLDESFVINDGGNLRTQVWHYPGRGECLSCHTPPAGYALGFRTAQLNRDFDYGGITDNEIRALNHAGYFSGNVSNLNTLPVMAHATNTAFSTEYRVRSYLAANCAQCHLPGGSALGNWDARISNPLSAANIVNGALVNNLGDANNRVIVPNDAAHSVLLTRISANGPLRMPPLASTLIDTQSVNLVKAWITNDLVSYKSFPQWQQEKFGSTNAPLTGASEDFDGDGSLNFQEYLLGTNPTDAGNFWKISAARSNENIVVTFPHLTNRGFEVQFATSLSPAIWQPLDVPANRPFFSATNFPAVVPDGLDETSHFYRVKTFEP
ncbi:MAG: PQQ-dependent sugar dehydrogenase [Verrucomicrobiota bacterium]